MFSECTEGALDKHWAKKAFYVCVEKRKPNSTNICQVSHTGTQQTKGSLMISWRGKNSNISKKLLPSVR
jgi:hypothetical protein